MIAIEHAEIIIKFKSGKTIKMGTLDLEADESKLQYKYRWQLRRKLGWALIYEGLRVMFKSN